MRGRPRAGGATHGRGSRAWRVAPLATLGRARRSGLAIARARIGTASLRQVGADRVEGEALGVEGGVAEAVGGCGDEALDEDGLGEA